MALHRIRKGLDLPLAGAPEQRIDEAQSPARVAILAADYVGMKPTMKVTAGDAVRTGDVLFEHKRLPAVRFTSPGAGTVAAVERGAKRALQSVIVQLDVGTGSQRDLTSFTGKHPTSCNDTEVRELLLESGLWTALRERPFGGVPDPDTRPHSLFVTVSDSNPLAPDPATVLAGRHDDFERGLTALSKLGDGPVYVCQPAGSPAPVPAQGPFRNEEFVGPHPAGTVGLHIHLLDPVDRNKRVWYLGAQDVVAIGRLFDTGTIDSERIVALGGPSVRNPRLLRTRLGAATDDLVAGEVVGGEHRVISGSALSGRQAEGPTHGFLGRYHQQITVLPEGGERELFGWLAPGAKRFSVSRTFLSRLFPGRRFAMDTDTNGSDRAIVPIGLYERVVPFDIHASFVLKALVMGDVERAEELGALELEEEDLGLCTFVCPSKSDYGPYLRSVLTILEKEG
jgi:Na+-transporting NADH:ubiquinone oxidoreductase subunit A